jgi:large subunit ribosomal protein L6e
MAVRISKSKRVSINGQVLSRSVSAKSTGKSDKTSQKPASIRASITPGTVLILLAGRFRGKRVVCLKQLSSGLLLVTGPYKVNGVPLKRVNQAYVIATSTKVDISSVKLSAKLDDALFQRIKESRVKKHTLQKSGAEVAKDTEGKAISAERKALQTEVDSQLRPIIKNVPSLTSYLGSLFTLKKGQVPHAMKF